MTRINTNVSSLNAQKSLARSNADLQQALTRLSTGLRINVGKDDPAGLIASEILRSDINSTSKAITNSQRANQMIATADSALGQVSALLNDIRGLVELAANRGAMSSDQIAANQLQVDSSLEAIDRIAQITQFQGKRLLDGNLDFLTTGVNSGQITNLQIDKCNFGTLSEVPVTIQLANQATKATLTYNGTSVSTETVVEIGGKSGYQAFTFAANSSISEIASAINLVSDATGVTAVAQARTATAATNGALTVTSAGQNNDLVMTAKTAGNTAGNVNIMYSLGNSTGTFATFSAPTGNTTANAGTLNVALQTVAWANANSGNVVGANGANVNFSADLGGAEFNGVTVSVSNGAVGAAPTFAYNHTTKVLSVVIQNNVTTGDNLSAALAANYPAINALFSVSVTGANGNTLLVADYATANLSNGVTGGGLAAGATANAVKTAIEANTNANANISVALASGNDGSGQVTVFQEYAQYGTDGDNNHLQFLGPQNSRDLRVQFVAGGANQTFSTDLTTQPPVYGQSSAAFRQTTANGSFKITAVNAGTAYDGATVNLVVTGASNYTSYDPSTKVLNVTVAAGSNAATVVNLVNSDTYVGKYFNASLMGAPASTGSGAVANATATTSGGLVSEGKLIINLATDANGAVTTTASDVVSYFNSANAPASLTATGITVSHLGTSTGAGKMAATSTDLTFQTQGYTYAPTTASGTTYTRGATASQLTFRAINSGAAYDDVSVVFANTATAGAETFSYDSLNKRLTVGVQSGTSTSAQVYNAWLALPASNTVRQLFSVDNPGVGAAVYDTDYATLSGGAGRSGSPTGVNMYGHYDIGDTVGTPVLTLNSADYGTAAFVSTKALSGTFTTYNTSNVVSTRETGTDIDARVNGVQAVADGLNGSISTFALDLKFALSSTMTAGQSSSFTITGGGAQFQLGPDVVSNQQIRIGITSVNTAKLGGVTGRMYELRSGGDKSLVNDIGGAASVTEESITQVTTLRGRLGALQKTSIDTNINALSDTLEALTDAESSIRDADFAAESSNLTRAQILVQSGTSVLSIANQRPQSVLSLLPRG